MGPDGWSTIAPVTAEPSAAVDRFVVVSQVYASLSISGGASRATRLASTVRAGAITAPLSSSSPPRAGEPGTSAHSA